MARKANGNGQRLLQQGIISAYAKIKFDDMLVQKPVPFVESDKRIGISFNLTS